MTSDQRNCPCSVCRTFSVTRFRNPTSHPVFPTPQPVAFQDHLLFRQSRQHCAYPCGHPASCLLVCLATLGHQHEKPFPQLVLNLQLLLHCFIKEFFSVTSKEMSQYFNNCQAYLMCTLWGAGLPGPGRG